MPGLATHVPMSAWRRASENWVPRPDLALEQPPHLCFCQRKALGAFLCVGGNVGSALWGTEAAWKHGSLPLGHCLLCQFRG